VTSPTPPGPRDVCTPYYSTRHTSHLGGHPSKYYPGPTLLDFGNQMVTGKYNVARCRSSPMPLVAWVHAFRIVLLEKKIARSGFVDNGVSIRA
jgi:hypothetical protein